MKMTYFSSAVMCAALAGCATDHPSDPEIQIQQVSVPVATSCVPADVPPPPATYPDDAIAQMSDPVDRTLARAAANQLRKARLAILEPVIKGCR